MATSLHFMTGESTTEPTMLSQALETTVATSLHFITGKSTIEDSTSSSIFSASLPNKARVSFETFSLSSLCSHFEKHFSSGQEGPSLQGVTELLSLKLDKKANNYAMSAILLCPASEPRPQTGESVVITTAKKQTNLSVLVERTTRQGSFPGFEVKFGD